MAPTSITRRGLLKGALGVTAGGAVGLLGFGVYCSGRRDASLFGGAGGAAGLALALRDPEGARWIGTRYMERFPEEADVETLEERIADVAQLDAVRCPATASAALAAAAREDFRAGRTVQIDGWVMGRTELRLCALMACLGPDGGAGLPG